MISVSFIVIQPIYESTVNRLVLLRTSMIETLEQKAGLSITYESMSPSILTGLRISKIQLIDAQNSLVLAKISSIRFSYNIINLIKRSENSLDSLIITGISAEFDEVTQKHIVEKLQNLFSSLNTKGSFNGLPFSIRISTAAVAYKNEHIRVRLQMRDTLVKNSISGKSIQFTSTNTLSCDFLDKTLSSLGPVSSNFTLQGSINHTLTESAVQLRIRELKNNDITVKPVEAAFWYTDEKLNLQILENVGSFNLFAEYTISKKEFDILLETEKFNPLSLLTIKKPSPLIKKIEGTALSGVYSMNGSLENIKALTYTAKGSISVPSSLVPRGLDVKIEAEGNLSFADITTLHISGPLCDIEYTGSIDIKNIQPQGYLSVNSYTLPNSNIIQAEMYLDPLKKGFLGFIPQLDIGDTSLTALQLEVIPDGKSIDFSLLCYDYSHYEYSQNAEVGVNGSVFLEGKPFLQSNIQITNLFLDTVFGVISYVISPSLSETFTDAGKRFEKFVVSTEMYVSTDFSAITYNTPYTIIANTAKDQDVAVLSFDGNETAFQISQLDILFSGQSLQATASADFSPDYSDMFFSSQLSVNSIPYELQGVLIDKNNIVLTGSYGLSSSIVFNSGSIAAGTLSFNSFPLSFKNFVFSLSADAAFEFNSLSQWTSEVMRLECVEATGAFNLSPSLSLSGLFDSYGGMINSLTYSDTVSILNGEGNLMWNIVDNVFDSAQCFFMLNESFTQESYEIDVNISNPFKKEASSLNFLDDIFCSGLITINSSPILRFLPQQTTDNVVSGQINILGTLANPSVSVRVSNASLNLQGENLEIQCFASLDDKVLNLSDTLITFSSFTFSNIEANLNLESFTGGLFGESRTSLGSDNNIITQFSASILPTSPVNTRDLSSSIFDTKFPETFLATLSLPLINSTKYGQITNFSLTIVRSKGRFDIQGGVGGNRSFTDNPINGYLLDNGECLLILDEELPVSFVAFGSIAKGIFDIQVNDLLFDAQGFKKIFDLGVFKINSGIAEGAFHLGGLLTDPEFNGSVDVTNFSCEVPDYIEGPITAVNAQLTGEGKYLNAENILGVTKSGQCVVDVAINFDKWQFESVVLNLETQGDETVKAFANLGLLEFEGNAKCNLTIIVRLTSVDITGSLYVDDAVGKIYPIELMNKKDVLSDIDVLVDLDIMIGQRAQAYLYGPEILQIKTQLIRALVNPMTPIKVLLNTRENTFSMIGDLVLRGGEVNIGRRFYLREGRMIFEDNPLQFDPVLTIRAEMRETDQNGELLRISLSAEEQKLSTFTYTLSSSPPKSEEEIMLILGKSLTLESTGSTSGDILNAVGLGLNIFVQNTVLKQIEEGLREFLKLDILSVKTSVLQNTLRLYSEQNTGKVLTPGNFLDNSTVYIGKYFGDVLYGDFLLHLSYDDSKVDSNNLASGIAFEPELGFEMESPLATIRWSIAPDVGSIHNLWVPYTSISLSWKFMF
jgi:hypothetical protein